jgi:cyanophycinase
MNKTKQSAPENWGRLLIIGGGEDRKDDMHILGRFVELAGGKKAKIVVLTAASTLHQEMWQLYQRAFTSIGVRDCKPVEINSREDANEHRRAEEVRSAGGIFMTGGDQGRLLAMIGGTALDDAMHRAFRESGACIAGTSAGASAMSEHMLVSGPSEALPQKGTTYLAAGLGFLQRAIVDQHFSERQRLGRLLGVIAQNPYLLGIGIDENTALIVKRDAGMEVIGEGAVTIIDGRHMVSNFLSVDKRELLELLDVKLHLLPAGARYYDGAEQSGAGADHIPGGLREAIAIITEGSNVT